MNTQNHRHWDHLRWLQTDWKNWEWLLFSSCPCARFLKDRWSFPRVSAIDMVGNSFCFRPGGVFRLSSEPRSVNEKVKSCKLIGKMWLGTNPMFVPGPVPSEINKKTNNFYILWGLSDISTYQQNLAWYLWEAVESVLIWEFPDDEIIISIPAAFWLYFRCQMLFWF